MTTLSLVKKYLSIISIDVSDEKKYLKTFMFSLFINRSYLRIPKNVFNLELKKTHILSNEYTYILLYKTTLQEKFEMKVLAESVVYCFLDRIFYFFAK